MGRGLTRVGGASSCQANVHVAERIQARVVGPHCHSPRSDGAAAGLETSLLVTLGKELENRYLVAADAGEAGVDAECGAKGLPEAPYGMQGGAALHSEKSKTKQEVHGHNARTHADASKREVQRQPIDMYKIHVQKLLHQDIGNHDQHT